MFDFLQTSSHSVCFYQQPVYNVSSQTISLQFKGSFVSM